MLYGRNKNKCFRRKNKYSERLYKSSIVVLCTTFSVTTAYDNENNEWSDWNGIDYYTVLAWQPLPDDKNLKYY